MKKSFKYIVNQGLPGGPNELKKFIQGSISVTGYKSDSPDVNNDFNIIPSNQITMQGVNFPVLGIDNLGNEQMMMPGGEYTFPGSMVYETPMMKKGGVFLGKSIKCSNCGHSWKAATGGSDPLKCHKCGGMVKMQMGGSTDDINYDLPEMGKGGLTQWFAEEWTDVKTGKKCGRSGKEKGSRPYPACRPKKRVNETTPKTTSEMSSAEKAKFKREKTSGKRISYNHKRKKEGGEIGWLEQYQPGGQIDLTKDIKDLKDQWYTTQEWDDAMPDSTFENMLEFIDPTGISSYDDARVAYRDWKRSGTTMPSMGQGLDMFGAVPGLGKLGKLKYLSEPTAKFAKAVYKYFPWQKALNAGDTVQDEVEKKKYGGWLDQYQVGGQKLTKEEIEKLKNEGVYIGGSSKSGKWGEKRLDRKNPDIIKTLSAEPTLEEVKSIIESVPGYNRGYESFYDADPKKIGVQEGPLTENRFSEISNYATDKELIDRYKNQSFGTLPMFEYTGVYEGYSPQRTWVGNKPYLGYSASERKNINKSKKDPLSTNPRYLYFISPNKDNQRFKDVSDSYTWTDEIFPTVWPDARKAGRSIINNSEITEYLKSKGVTSEELSKATKAYYDEDGIPMTSQLGEALITNRILNNENAWVRPATNDTSIVIQDRNKFNLAGYLPVTAGMEDSWNEKKEDYFRQQGIPESEWPYVTIHTSPFPIQEYKSSDPNTTSNRTKPKRPPFMYQQGGLFPVGPYDEMMAPKQGNYLLPDINRPSYIDNEGGRRSEYRTGINIDGKETLIPTVVGGIQLSDDETLAQFERTGLHMGQYDTVKAADAASKMRTAKYNMLEDPIRFKMQKGGWLEQYQYAGETSTEQNPERMNPINISAKRRNQDYRTYQDNTINNNQIVPSEFRGRRYIQPTLSEYVEPSIGDRILNTLASPMTALSNNRTGSRNPFDYALDMVNPFSWIQSGERAVGSLAEGQYTDAALNALGAIPALGFADDAGRAISKAGRYATTRTPLKNTYKINPLAEKLKNPNKSYGVAGEDAYEDFIKRGVRQEVKAQAQEAESLDNLLRELRQSNFDFNELRPPPSEIRLFGSPRQNLSIDNFDLNLLMEPKNISGLTKEEVLLRAAAKEKELLSKMSNQEFRKTVLKPTGEITPTYEGSIYDYFKDNNAIASLSYEDYIDVFNSRLDLLNDIIAERNKSGVEYGVKGLDKSGRLTFYTPQQTLANATKPVPQHYLDALDKIDEPDFLYKGHNDQYFFSNMTGSPGFNSQKEAKNWITNLIEEEQGKKIPGGESTWGVNVNPGQWRGEVQDIANKEYFQNIPGIEISNSTEGVFADGIPRTGSGAYESINEYLKKLDLGRVKPGFNSQTEFSRGAWENFIKSGRAVGYYGKPTTVYGTMKSFAPISAGIGLGASQLQEKKYGGQTNWLEKYK